MGFNRMVYSIEISSPPNLLSQKLVDLGEGFGTKKSAVGAEWRRMGALNDAVSVGSDVLLFALGMLAPQYKYDGDCLQGQSLDDIVGKPIPTQCLVRKGLVLLYCQGGV